MFSTVYIICMDICAFVFLGFGVHSIVSKKPAMFLWNKGSDKIPEDKTKNYNRGVAILYAFLGLCLMVVGLVANYIDNLKISNILLIAVLVIVFPTLSYAYSMLVSKYSKK